MALCSASSLLGCAVPLPCFPERAVPHTHAHTDVQRQPALHFSLPAAGRQDLCIPSSLGPSEVQSLLPQEQELMETHLCVWLKLSALEEADEVENQPAAPS